MWFRCGMRPRSRAAAAGGRVSRGRARAGAAVRRRGPVPGGGCGHGEVGRRRRQETAGEGVRHRRRDDGRPESGRHRRAADACGARDDARATGSCTAARICHRASGQHRVAAAAGVQPDQSAGVQRRGPVVPSLHRGDGAVVAGRRCRRVPFAALAFRPRSRREASTRADRGSGAGPGFRARGAVL